jgi:YadA-like protein
MKKTLLLIGALAILSSTAMGVTEQWVTKEITAGLEVNNMIRDIEREEDKKEIATNARGLRDIGTIAGIATLNHNNAAQGMKESVEKHLGKFDHAKDINGNVYGDVSGEVQAQAFDVVTGAVAKNQGDIEKNKNTIADLSSVVASKASVSDVNTAKDQANSAMGIAIDNTGKINNATDGMIASAGKLGITVETVEANSKYLEAGKVQAEIFDKTVDVVANNKKESEENTASISKQIDYDTLTAGGMADSVSKLGEDYKVTHEFSKDDDVQSLNNSLAKQQSFDKAVDAIVDNKQDLVAVNKELDTHKEEAAAREVKIDGAINDLKVTDGKVNTAIEGLQETDEKVDVAILSLKEKDKQLEAVDKAIYEVVGNTRDKNATPIKENKIDNNRDRIVLLENTRATTEEQTTINTDDIATNKDNIKSNKEEIDINTSQVNQALELADNNSEHIEKNSKRIDGLEKKVDGLESKMNKGLAMAAATSSIVYPHLGRGDVGIGAGIGGYGGSQAIAIGVAMQPTENVRINTNVSTSDSSDTMYGAGVGYKFNIFGS